jgi:hypothetical protein
MRAAAVTSLPDVLPELAEADASAPIKAIYNALRRGSASPIAALIWRHIATHPDVLEECWASLEPLFASGQLPETAWRVARETVPKELLPQIEPRAQRLLGITQYDAATIAAVAEAYNRANPVNLLGVLTLLARAVTDKPFDGTEANVDWSPPPTITQTLPRMTPPIEILPEIRWLLNDLGFGDRSQLDAVVPSLYRHLTDWPIYLAVLHMSLAPHFRDGTMAAYATRVEHAMAIEAVALARHTRPVPKLIQLPALRATMRRFTRDLIPQMIVVGRAIADQMSPQSPGRVTGRAV